MDSAEGAGLQLTGGFSGASSDWQLRRLPRTRELPGPELTVQKERVSQAHPYGWNPAGRT